MMQVKVKKDAAKIYMTKWKGKKETFKGERVHKGVHANRLRSLQGGIFEANLMADGSYDLLVERHGKMGGYLNVNPECIEVIS